MRTAITTVVAVLALIAVAGAAFIYSGAYYIGADKPHWPTTTWLLKVARDRSIRAYAAGITEPTGLGDPAHITAGALHYSEHCAICHGAPGVERDQIGDGLYPRPPNLADSVKLYTPAELFWIVKHGIRMTGMPSLGDHSDDELWATIAFIEKLPGITEQDYVMLIDANRIQGGHKQQDQQPSSEPSPQAAETNLQSEAPAITQHPGSAAHDQPVQKPHSHGHGSHHH